MVKWSVKNRQEFWVERMYGKRVRWNLMYELCDPCRIIRARMFGG